MIASLFGPNIVTIDDNFKEIAGIQSYCIEQGIGYKYFNSDLSEGDNQPKEPINTVKLLFVDFFYSGDFDPDIVVGWINSIIPENHFYILVAWSKHPENSDIVLEELHKINKEPLFCFQCGKKNYKTDGQFNFLQLMSDLNEQLQTKHGLYELFGWKQSINKASDNIIYNISFEKQKLCEKIKKIMCVKHGKRVNDLQPPEKLEGLFDALDYVLFSNTRSHRQQYLNNIPSSSIVNDEIDETSQKYQDAEINSWFLIKKNSLETKIFIEIGTIFRVHDENFLESYSIQKCEKFKGLYDNATNPENLIPITILITPSCDFAQKKHGGNYKLLSGVIINNIPRNVQNQKIKYSETKYNPPDSIKIIDHLNIEKLQFNNATLVLDYRYSHSVSEANVLNSNKYEPICTVSKDLISSIQVAYSAYSSRIGYLSM